MENNKTAEEIKNKVANNNNFDSFERAIQYTFNRPLLQSEKAFINKLFDESMEEYASQFKPLSKVGEVTDEQIDEAIEKALDDEGIDGREITTKPMRAIRNALRSLLQPQPVNSEGKGKADNYSKIHSALFELVKLKDYKDANGKTEAYVKKQKEAWEYAKQVLSASSEGKKELVGNFCQASKVSNGFNDEQPTFEQGKKEGVKYFAENNQYWREMRFNGQIIKSEITKKEFVELINCLESDTVVEQVEAKEPTDLDETALRQKFLNWCLEHYTADKTITVEDYFQWFLPHLAFRSSEVKEQEDIKIYDWFCAKCGVYAMDEQNAKEQVTDEMIAEAIGKLHPKDRGAFSDGVNWFRSLQVKSNEQTKKDG